MSWVGYGKHFNVGGKGREEGQLGGLVTGCRVSRGCALQGPYRQGRKFLGRTGPSPHTRPSSTGAKARSQLEPGFLQ